MLVLSMILTFGTCFVAWWDPLLLDCAGYCRYQTSDIHRVEGEMLDKHRNCVCFWPLLDFRFFSNHTYIHVLCPTAFYEIISLFQGLFGHLRVWDMILFDWVGRCRYQTEDTPHKRIQTLTNAFSYITVNVIQKSKNL